MKNKKVKIRNMKNKENISFIIFQKKSKNEKK